MSGPKISPNWRELDAARRYCQVADSLYRSALDRKKKAAEELASADSHLRSALQKREEAQKFLRDAERRNEVINIAEDDEDAKPRADAGSSEVEVVDADESGAGTEAEISDDVDDDLPLARLVTPDHRVRKRSRNNSGDRGSAPAARRRLAGDESEEESGWIDGMERFLLDVPHGRSNKTLSEANTRMVIRQVRVLAGGEGVTYRHWPEGVAFAPGRPIDLSADLDALHEEAVEFEKTHGKDKGNGWLLRHPITKMRCYHLENQSV